MWNVNRITPRPRKQNLRDGTRIWTVRVGFFYSENNWLRNFTGVGQENLPRIGARHRCVSVRREVNVPCVSATSGSRCGGNTRHFRSTAFQSVGLRAALLRKSDSVPLSGPYRQITTAPPFASLFPQTTGQIASKPLSLATTAKSDRLLTRTIHEVATADADLPASSARTPCGRLNILMAVTPV